jgi:hypothetical protein
MRFVGCSAKLRGAFFAFIAVISLAACASVHHVSDEYRESFGGAARSTSHRTVILFLIDGLPAFTLQRELQQGHLPEIENYFVRGKNQIYLARTTFPSLTFPGIGSLLTERPVNANGLYGNQILHQGERINFESPLNTSELADLTRGQNIFARLHGKGFKSVSIDYAFNADADASIRAEDIEAALDIEDKHYEKVDNKLIQSLEDLLNTTDAKQWPDFIFVHLVGVDFLTHDYGPEAPEVRKYLRTLDTNLKGVLRTLRTAESKNRREVVSLLTADHGVDVKIEKYASMESVLNKIDPGISVLNEGRYLSLFFPKAWSPLRKTELLAAIANHPDVDITAFRENAEIFVQSKDLSVTMNLTPADCHQSAYALTVDRQTPGVRPAAATALTPTCPEALDAQTNQLYYPYFMSNLSYYFGAPGHPDAVIVPKPGVTFKNNGYRGQHGGPTVREVFVPLLLRNATLPSPDKIPALWELLGFME